MTRRLHAKRVLIPAGFKWFAQQQVDFWKVQDLRAHIRAGGKVPPVVVARYGDEYMPLDGHHRSGAHADEDMPLDAWVVSGRAFDNLDIVARDSDPPCHAEDLVLCDGVPALQVASLWRESVDKQQASH